jgi:two-component system, cell cycle sensor histidine kinase and response regulator CckA
MKSIFRHLRTKLLVAILAVVCALTTAVLTLVQLRMNRHVREDLSANLEAEAAAFRKINAAARRQNDQSALLISNLPSLKALLSTRDALTVQDGSAALLPNSGADLLVLEGTSGEMLAFHSKVPGLGRSSIGNLLAASGNGNDLWFSDGHLLQVSFAPVYLGPAADQRLLGRVALGDEISPATVAGTNAFAQGKVLMARNGHVLLGSLEESRWQEFDAWLQRNPVPAGSIQEVVLGGERYFANSVRLAGAHPVFVFSLQSYDQATSFLGSLNRLLFLVGILAILCGALTGSVLSRQITWPVEQLAKGARRLEKGDFEFQVVARGGDEVAELTRAFEKMRTSLKRSREDLLHAARLEAVGRLAGGIAHDFNNLVMVIQGYSDLLLDSASSQTRPLIEEIRRAGDRAGALTRQLLAFSRKQVVEPQIVNPNQVVRDMTKMIRLLLGTGIELETELSETMASLKIDPTQVEQVVMNLAVNARDAMPSGGRLIVETKLATPESANRAPSGEGLLDTHVLLSVTDTGCGMNQETLAHIFEPFFTTKEPGKGTGLGLATVYHIVNQCQGHIAVRSEAGTGTTFDVYLPALHVAAPVLKLQAPRVTAPVNATVLLVEDDEPLRVVTAESLQRLGYRVLQAGNGLAALAITDQYPGTIDVVVTDVIMPRMGGPELVQQLRSTRSEFGVIYMTANPEAITLTNTKLDAESIILYKPFPGEALAQKINQLREGARKAKGAAASSWY